MRTLENKELALTEMEQQFINMNINRREKKYLCAYKHLEEFNNNKRITKKTDIKQIFGNRKLSKVYSCNYVWTKFSKETLIIVFEFGTEKCDVVNRTLKSSCHFNHATKSWEISHKRIFIAKKKINKKRNYNLFTNLHIYCC